MPQRQRHASAREREAQSALLRVIEGSRTQQEAALKDLLDSIEATTGGEGKVVWAAFRAVGSSRELVVRQVGLLEAHVRRDPYVVHHSTPVYGAGLLRVSLWGSWVVVCGLDRAGTTRKEQMRSVLDVAHDLVHRVHLMELIRVAVDVVFGVWRVVSTHLCSFD